MAAIKPDATRLRSSLRASQQAIPKEHSAAPAIRAIVNPAVVSSGVPRSKETTIEGASANATPAPASITEVAMNSSFMDVCGPRLLRLGARSQLSVIDEGDGRTASRLAARIAQ